MRVLLLLIAAAFAAAGVAFPTAATVTTAEGTKLAAVWGIPAKSTRGVVLVHPYGRNKEDWQFLGEKLYRDGTAVLAVDLRGHGANVVGSATELSPADFQAMVGDVASAVATLQARGVSKISLVGAELGANLVVNVAVDNPAVVSLVLLSPGMEYKGIIAADAVKRYGNRPVALVAGTDDIYGARSAAALDASAVGEHVFRLLDGAGKGTKMLNREPSLEGWIVGWIATHWGVSS